jgi:hypothetical protein
VRSSIRSLRLLSAGAAGLFRGPTRSPDWIAAFAQVQKDRLSGAAEVVRKIPTAKRPEGTPSLAPAAYAGVYRDAWYGTVTIFTGEKAAGEKGALQIRFDRSPGMVSALEHVRHDTFRTRFADRRIEDTYVTFALRPDGSIDQMKMQAVSPIADFSFDYHDLLFKPEAPKP